MTVYGRARRAKKTKLKKKKVATCIILGIIILAIIYMITSNKLFDIKDNSEPKEETQISQNNTEENTIIEEKKQDEIVDVEIPEKMGKYEVLGQLNIEKIGVSKNILNISEDTSLELSVAKLYGPNINESGNFCISGHNWNNMLKRLSEMQVGDTFSMIGRKTKTKVDYQIYDIYTCVPEDLSCLHQNNDGKREVTLITCNPGGLTRLICKAREI